MKRLEFFYDFSCPYAYLAHLQVALLAKATDVELVWKPMLLGGVFKALSVTPSESMGKEKAAHNLADIERWADYWGVTLKRPEGHPCRTVLALRATLASKDIPRASRALFRAYWQHGKDVSDKRVVEEALSLAGFDGQALVRAAEEQPIKDELAARTDEAVARGVFGAPTFVVDMDGERQLFWGQDRLVLVERLLKGNESDDTLSVQTARVVPSDPAEVDFYFDFSSPFSYIAFSRLHHIVATHQARVVYRPFLLGGLFKAIGTPNVPLFEMSIPKREHSQNDLERWTQFYGLPFRFPSRFPMNTVKPLRLVFCAEEKDRPRLMQAIFRAYWVDDRDISDETVLAEILTKLSLPAQDLCARMSSDEAKQAVFRATDEAVRASVFGAPTFIVHGYKIWGQDRLEFVDRILGGWRPRM